MKFCHMCGTQNEDGFLFCYACGERLITANGSSVKSTDKSMENTAAPAEEVQYEEAEKVSEYGPEKIFEESASAEPVNDPYSPFSPPRPSARNVVDDHYVYSDTEERHDSAYADFNNRGYDHSYNRNSRKPFLIAGIVVALAFVIVLAGYFTDWFGTAPPMGSIIKAFANTLSAKSGTLSFSGNVDIYGDYSEEIDNAELRYRIDFEEEELDYIYNVNSDEKYVEACLYNNMLYTYMSQDDDVYANEVDMDDSIEEMFDSVDDFVDDDGINWKKIIRENNLEEYIDSKEVESFLTDFYKECLGDEQWLEDKLGYKKVGKTHIFEPDIEELTEELIEILLDSDLLESGARRDIRNNRDDLLDELAEADNYLKIEIRLFGKYVSSIDVEYESKDNEAELHVEFSKMNRTRITDKEQTALKKKVRDAMDDNYCKECGQEFYSIEQKSTHGDCRDYGYSGDEKFNCAVCGEILDEELKKYENEDVDLMIYLCDDCFIKYYGD